MATLDVLTLAEGKQAVNLTGVSTSDAELALWITTVSLLLDRHVGPIVVRTVTNEMHDGGGSPLFSLYGFTGVIFLRRFPVTSFTTITEYSGTTATVLTAETNLSKPSASYLAQRYGPDPALYSGRLERRASGSCVPFPAGTGNVVVTYEAGRFSNTGTVDERFKAAARLTLASLWNSQRPNLAQVGEFEVPMSNWPKFAVPNAVQEMLRDEWQTGQWAAGAGGVLVG